MPQQTHFPVRITCPKAAEPLFFEQLTSHERLSEPYTLQLTVLSEKNNIQSQQLLGQPMTVLVEQPAGGDRYFHGIVSRFVQTGEQVLSGERVPRQLFRYQLRLQPWFWFLTRAADCRVFQKKTVPDIFEAIAKDHGFHDYKLSLTGTYDPREYCVQYRETDFNFLSRLLEEVGIRYFFKHEAERHIMVLADGSDAHQPAQSYAEVKFRLTAGSLQNEDSIESWWVESAVQPGSYVTTDFDFEKPKLSLLKSSVKSRPHACSAFEVFDYPASSDGLTPSSVERLAKVRLEELQSSYERYHGTGSHCVGLRTGAKFKLTQHPLHDFQREYIIIGSSHSVVANQYASGADGTYSVSVAVEAIDSKTPYRPMRTTPKPVIQGTQTAVVVGTSGAEIDTDKYGRVKVQFPWDRVGKNDQNSSCWVRVAQVWAGKNWGAMHIPRVGQEVLVSFMEGDPDRPIVTGRVYNGESMPPYELPGNMTQSGLVSRSTKDGTAANCNEIRFEDKKGSEQLLFHAEKDLITEVENDRSISVGHDETVEIKNDRASTVHNNETCKVDKDHATTIGNDEKRDVAKNRTATVGADEKLTVGGSQTTDVSRKYTLTAGEEIVLQVGASKLAMKADGTIQLNGVDIKIEGSVSLKQTAGVKIELSTVQYKLGGNIVQIQGTLLDLQAGGIATLKGALTQIG
jgi:type VI secretion system secreted protein VgrG